MDFLKQLIVEERGVSSIEYALVGLLIAVVIVSGVASVGTQVLQLYNNLATKVVTSNS